MVVGSAILVLGKISYVESIPQISKYVNGSRRELRTIPTDPKIPRLLPKKNLKLMMTEQLPKFLNCRSYSKPETVEKMKSPILVLALLALAGLAPAAQASSQTTTFNKSFSFDNLTVTVSGTITVDTTAQTISGSVTVTVVNDTSGQTIFSRTIPINLSFNTNNGARFVLEVPTFPTALAISSGVTSGSTTSTSFGVSKTPDINHDGVINIVDLTSIAANFGTSNSVADLTSDGTVNIQDLTLVAIDFGDPVVFV